MSRRLLRLLPLLLLLAVLFADVSLASACPGCKDALASQDPTQTGLVRGFFWSILFMMGMPFLLLSGLGALMYREVRRARAAQQGAPPAEAESSLEPAAQETSEQPVGV